MDKLKLYLEYWLKDSKGKTKKYRRYRSDSFVGNFFKFLYHQIGRASSYTSFTSVNEIFLPGSSDDIKQFPDGTLVDAMADIARSLVTTTTGIIVGSGTTAVSLDDYSLASQIPNGTGAGQLVYGSNSITTIDQTLSNLWFYRISRTFTNQSTTPITITEVGLVGNVYDADTLVPCLMARDLLPSPITLNPNDATVIRYTIKLQI
jgi:hypothetical protein